MGRGFLSSEHCRAATSVPQVGRIIPESHLECQVAPGVPQASTSTAPHAQHRGCGQHAPPSGALPRPCRAGVAPCRHGTCGAGVQGGVGAAGRALPLPLCSWVCGCCTEALGRWAVSSPHSESPQGQLGPLQTIPCHLSKVQGERPLPGLTFRTVFLLWKRSGVAPPPHPDSSCRSLGACSRRFVACSKNPCSGGTGSCHQAPPTPSPSHRKSRGKGLSRQVLTACLGSLDVGKRPKSRPGLISALLSLRFRFPV